MEEVHCKVWSLYALVSTSTPSTCYTQVKHQSDIADKHAAEGVKAAEVSALKQIVAKYNLSKEDLDKLVKWKHTHY